MAADERLGWPRRATTAIVRSGLLGLLLWSGAAPSAASEAAPISRTITADAAALARMAQPPLGLPPVPIPSDNSPTTATIRLGRKLFLDRRLSRDGNLSCAMCHVPEQGFTSNELRTAVGTEGTSLPRNSPTLFNAAYAAPFFHDGREPELDLQPFDVFLNPDEMAAPSLGAFVARVRALPDYGRLFEAAFGGPPTVARIGRSLATYLRTLISGNSPFDRWFFGGESEAVSPAAKRGFRLFVGEAGCARCHLLEQGYALFTDHRFHDTGLGWEAAMGEEDPVTVELAPGVFQEIAREALDSISDPRPNDLGRYQVTGDPADRWKFKTPILRNLTLTAPYMHDGSLSSLRAVVGFYDRGGVPHQGLDPAIRPLDLDPGE
ncbi:MAG: cytochrome-c peroxidase, partial [Thermoanaerobaculia bacterium]